MQWPRFKTCAAFLLGLLAAILIPAALAEGYLRLFPPRDLDLFLGDASRLTGIYAPDEDFVVGYQSWQAMYEDNAAALDPFLSSDVSSTGSSARSSTGGPDARPTWAMFGNSFVQAPGMLADTARAMVPGYRVINLGRNEHLCLRMAQIKLLLEQGLRPQRIFFVLMPVDCIGLGEQPLDSIYPTASGALTYHPRLPAGPLGQLLEESRLALTGWVRIGRHVGNPQFDRRTLYDGIDEPLLGDLRLLLRNLARVTREAGVPVTVILIPAYHQIARGASFEFQEVLKGILRTYALDVLDPRDVFVGHAKPESLFLPDLHFNAEGNRLLLEALVDYVRESPGMLARAPNDTRRQ